MNRKVNEYGIPEPIISKGEKFRTTSEPAYSTEEVSELLSIPTEKLKAMRQDNTGPKFYPLNSLQGELVIYVASDLTEWMRKRDGNCAQEKDKSDEL